jgi:hypothetical protein
MALDPSVPDMQSDVDAAERAALNAGIADLQAQLGADGSSMIPSLAARSGWIKVASPVSVTVSLVGYDRLEPMPRVRSPSTMLPSSQPLSVV